MSRDTRLLAAVIAAIPGAILTAATLCTWGIANGASERWRLPFLLICHGIPHRCLEIWSVPMPLCARCTAIYAGLAVGILVFRLVPYLTEAAARRLMFAAAIPMAIDGFTQLARLRESNNLLRMETGLVAGVAFAFWALTAMEKRVLTSP